MSAMCMNGESKSTHTLEDAPASGLQWLIKGALASGVKTRFGWPEGLRSLQEWIDYNHAPRCETCKWAAWVPNGKRKLCGHYPQQFTPPDLDYVCRKNAPNNKKTPPWPEVAQEDVCLDHVHDPEKMQSDRSTLECWDEGTQFWDADTYNDLIYPQLNEQLRIPCSNPECGYCRPRAAVGVSASPGHAGPRSAKPDTARQRELRAACEAAAQAGGHTAWAPIAAARGEFTARHHVDDPDPKRASKKRLNAWTFALSDPPPGFEVDKAGGVIRWRPAQPPASAGNYLS